MSEISRALARGDLDEALLLLARYYGEAELASRALEQLLETEPHRRQVTARQIRAQLRRDIRSLVVDAREAEA
jgi:hypothetical protein